MADDAGTPNAGDSGDNGATAQPVGLTPPAEWAESEHFKPFYKEDKSFDLQTLGKSYLDLAAKQPVLPKSVDEYTFEFPADFKPDDAAWQLHREMAMELGLTQKQFEGVTKNELAAFARNAKAEAEKLDAAKAELIKEWGGKQSFDARIEKCKGVAKAVFGEKITESELATNPDFVKGLWTIANKITEHGLVLGGQSGAGSRPLGIDGRPILDYSKTTPGPQRP